MNGSDASRNHTRADLVLLHQLWAEGVPTAEIARRFGVAMSTVTKWAQRYKLPRRTLHPANEPEAPTPEDDAASLDGLALSPWVEERARAVREKHYESRRREEPCNTHSKVSKWRHGICQPRGLA
jgi:transposase-like protein